mmetsp:Transcript_32875/g.79929  ORF Transcript_32875/g.79929 Transcript_32875/m.79929 type:complete len:426 (+) Transcript_32875:194-1471(+)
MMRSSSPIISLVLLAFCHCCWFIFSTHLADASSTSFIPVAAFHHTGHDRRHCQPSSAAFLDQRSVAGNDEEDTVTKWIELKDDPSVLGSADEKEKKQIPRSKLIMWGSFNPIDPFQQESFDDDDDFSTTTMDTYNNNDGDGEHPLRTNIWEFNLKLFNQFPFLWQRQRQQFSKKENCLNSILWNPQKENDGPGSSSSSSSVKLYVELHPSGLCRAMMESPLEATNHHNSVNNKPKRSIWSSLFGSRTLDDTATSSPLVSSSSSLPVALGSWKSRPWGVIVCLNPLDWNDDTQVVGVKQQQQLQQQSRRKRIKDSLVQERTARWISSQEYILTAKAFDYDFFGTNPTLSQGTIVFSNQKKHFDKILMKKNRRNQSKDKKQNSRPVILVRDLYRDVPLVDNRYFGNLGWGKQWFLPVVGTFKASGVV